MDSQESPAVAEPGKVGQAVGFLYATRAELEKMSWPSKQELFNSTRAVLISAAVLGVVIGVLDFVLTKILVDGVSALTR